MDKLVELKKLKEQIALGGGQKRIDAQHARGKMTARERIDYMLDDNSFVEIDVFVSHRSHNFGMENNKIAGDGVVSGYGTINSRLVAVYAQDFTVYGGALGESHAAKIVKIQELALKMGAPIIALCDSGGARIQEGGDAQGGYGRVFRNNIKASGVIPQISVIMGPCAGGAVYSPAISDFIFMVDDTSKMFITGPEVIKSVTGEDISAENLGGAVTHSTVSGVVHCRGRNDKETLDKVRELLSYIPNNNLETPQIWPTADSMQREIPELNSFIPEQASKSYDMYALIKMVSDEGQYFESMPHFAKNIITCFIRLNGKTVGVVASQPKVLAGCLDIDCSDKAARFIRFCDCFNIPMLSIADVPGYLPGVKQEYGGIIRHGAKLLYAWGEATVPKITVIVRKSYGGAYHGLCSKEIGADLVFAWPSAELAVMGAEGAANIVFKNEIEKAEDPEKKRQEKIKEYKDLFFNPYRYAERGQVDDVFEPSETRKRLIFAFDMLESKRESSPAKKHGNIPL
ncbi:MAG: carboxyl transferase domain-containing protein [Eubacteriales bacterium]|nr:carboxyl transferase domain-containing protein [Eubacteriales bacterium]